MITPKHHSAFTSVCTNSYILLGKNYWSIDHLEPVDKNHFFFSFFLDNFVGTPLRLFLKEEGNRLSPSGFPRGPAYVN